MQEHNPLPSLEQNPSDGLAAVLKGLSGLVPTGNILAELILPHIKNQWQERVTNFVQILENRLSNIEVKIDAWSGKIISNILEEGTLQAMRLQSEKRIEELASLVANTLKQETINEDISISMIKTLSELNDTEMIILISRSKLVGPEFIKAHANIIQGGRIMSGSTEEEHLFQLMYPKFLAHLVELHLLKPVYERPPKSVRQDSGFKIESSIPPREWKPTKVVSYSISGIGLEMLKLIGINKNS